MQCYLLTPCPSEEMLEDCVGKGITNVLLCSVNCSPPLFSVFGLWNICGFFCAQPPLALPQLVTLISAMLYAAQESAKGQYSSS